jgi:hypothetical protein
MEQAILTIYNRHTEACGPPPAVSNESPDVYVGYFENRYGEQWIFTYDRRTRTAILRGGDTHWAATHVVLDGEVDGLILGAEESTWLRACWEAAGG